MNKHVQAKVTIRSINPHIGTTVKPECRLIDNKVFNFMFGWVMNKDDNYPGETAWIPTSDDWPISAPIWIASGDLEILKEWQ